MRLTVHSDYALRVLMYLGARKGQLATIEEIAKAYAISEMAMWTGIGWPL